MQASMRTGYQVGEHTIEYEPMGFYPYYAQSASPLRSSDQHERSEVLFLVEATCITITGPSLSIGKINGVPRQFSNFS